MAVLRPPMATKVAAALLWGGLSSGEPAFRPALWRNFQRNGCSASIPCMAVRVQLSNWREHIHLLTRAAQKDRSLLHSVGGVSVTRIEAQIDSFADCS